MVTAPLSNEELSRRADLVVEARVLSRANGKATLSIKRIAKGEPRLQQRGWLHRVAPRRTILVAYRSQPPRPTLGDWWNEDVFLPGNRVHGFLVWDDRGQCYEAVWWNGAAVIRHP